jgi:hypothetical protein
MPAAITEAIPRPNRQVRDRLHGGLTSGKGLLSFCVAKRRLLAQSGHPDTLDQGPLSGVKRTSKFKSVTSAFDPKRTSNCLADSPSHAVQHFVQARTAGIFSEPAAGPFAAGVTAILATGGVFYLLSLQIFLQGPSEGSK